MKTGFFPPAPSYSFSGLHCRVLLEGSQVDDRVTVVELELEPGARAPLHASPREDKAFRMLDGELAFEVGDHRRRLGRGDVVHVGRGVPHAFTNQTNATAVVLLISTPAGHEAFFRDLAGLTVPHRIDEVAAVAERHHQQLVLEQRAEAAR